MSSWMTVVSCSQREETETNEDRQEANESKRQQQLDNYIFLTKLVELFQDGYKHIQAISSFLRFISSFLLVPCYSLSLVFRCIWRKAVMGERFLCVSAADTDVCQEDPSC